MSRPRFLPVALALCLLALALAAHAEPAVFETELIATERGDACTMADCWEGWHACTRLATGYKLDTSTGFDWTLPVPPTRSEKPVFLPSSASQSDGGAQGRSRPLPGSWTVGVVDLGGRALFEARP